MGKLFCLIGRSGCGKSTIEKELNKLGFLRIVSTTSRPRRDGEVDGVDYHYVTKEQVVEMIENGELLEYTRYNNWYYGIGKKQVDLSLGNYVCVVETEGFQKLQKALGKENVVGIHVSVGYLTLLKRSYKRLQNPTIKQCIEICRRFLSDFKTFRNVDKLCSIKVENKDLGSTVNTILMEMCKIE